jgi:hypothetical protein
MIVEVSGYHKLVDSGRRGIIASMLGGLTRRILGVACRALEAVRISGREPFRPRPGAALGFVADIVRSRDQLVAENALLRQQLIVAQRHVKRPKLRSYERAIIVGLTAVTRGWQSAVLLVQPDTVLRWHREGFRLFWRKRSRTRKKVARIPEETIELIRRLAVENRLWGAERVRGELLKLGVQVPKKTILKHMRRARGPRPWGQSWSTFLRNHMHQAWACDFLQLYDIWFRPIFAFFIIELGSRKVLHIGVTHNPTATWDGAAASGGNALRLGAALPHSRQRRQVRHRLRPRGEGGWYPSPPHRREGTPHERLLRAVSRQRSSRVRRPRRRAR